MNEFILNWWEWMYLDVNEWWEWACLEINKSILSEFQNIIFVATKIWMNSFRCDHVNECNLCTKWIYSHLLLYVLIQMGFKWDKMSHNSSDWTLQTSQAFRQKMIVWIVSTKPKFEFIFQLAFWVWTCSVLLLFKHYK